MNINQELKTEIDLLLKKYDLNKFFTSYGDLFITGSYVYNLMAWRDFDVVLQIDDYNPQKVYSLVKDIAIRVNPDELKILNNIDGVKQNRPKGYWIGIYVENWKIDLWVMDAINTMKEVKQTEQLDEMLTSINKDELIRIKLELSKNPDYHKKFSSVDLYNAYLTGGVKTVNEFYLWLKKQN